MSEATLDRLRAILGWAEGDDRVRALILNGSRARPGAVLDQFSDTDVALVVSEIESLEADMTWHEQFGEQLVGFPNEGRFEGHPVYNRLVLYSDGAKVDFLCWPQRVVLALKTKGQLPPVLDQGYEVLLDKDDLCVGLPAPSGQAFLVRKPSERDFFDLVNEFWWETTYVARNLARGELLFAKYNLDYVMKLQVLRRLLEWRVSADHGWDYRAGLLGRGLHPRLEPDLWAELEGTFGGGDLAENWASLWRTCVLFRRLAQEMAVRLGVNYPLELDDRVTGFLKRIENEQS